MRKFAVFIMTHGRADDVRTIGTLHKHGYTGEIYLVVDNEDMQQAKYIENFGKDSVIIFDKKAVAERIDTMDNTGKRLSPVFARNEIFNIAKRMGYTHFWILEDDYNDFRFRLVRNGLFTALYVNNLDEIIGYMLDFLDSTNALTICFAQGGDYIGGAGSRVFKHKLTRKAMNTYFCRTDRPISFPGRINEDVNAYVINAIRGNLLFTIGKLCIDQPTTQSNAGGMTDEYLASGTYVKSFYTVMLAPSCVKISTLGMTHQRIHHKVYWNNCAPKILNPKWKK